MNDLISRRAAIEAIEHRLTEPAYQHEGEDWYVGMNCAESELYELPSAQPEIKPIDYQDCANAMMKMWMDNVLTDGEYNRIMDKLNKHEMERRKADERSDL